MSETKNEAITFNGFRFEYNDFLDEWQLYYAPDYISFNDLNKIKDAFDKLEKVLIALGK